MSLGVEGFESVELSGLVALNLFSFWDQAKRFVENRSKYKSLCLEVRLKFAVKEHYCSVDSSYVWHIVILGSIYNWEIGHIGNAFWEVWTSESEMGECWVNRKV